MTDLASVLRVATRMRGIGITRRQSRERVRTLVREADRARERKEWSEASLLYQQALQLDPLQHGIRVQLGHAYKEQGDLASAGLCYEAALQLRPLDDDVYLQIGHLEKLRGNLDAAVLAYRKAAELNPLNADAISEHAALLPRLGSAPSAGGATPTAANGSTGAPYAGAYEREAADELRVRGDAARDARRWGEAASAYRTYLAVQPKDYPIWVQLGHALKEGGDAAGSEAAYRAAIALVPVDADAHLHLGHVLKLRGRTEEAIDAYRRSFELQPLRGAFAELAAFDRASDEVVLRAPAAAERPPQILIDVSDLLIHLVREKAVSGIQRVQLALVASLRSGPARDECRFAIWRDRELWVLPDRLLHRLAYDGTAQAMAWPQRRSLLAELEAQAVLYTPAAGDTVVSTGVTYLVPDLVVQRERLRRAGVRFGAYLYDLIPLTHPEFCADAHVDEFCMSLSEALVHADFLLTISEHVAAEARRLLQQAGFPPVPVHAVPIAHAVPSNAFPGRSAAVEPAAEHWTPAISGLRGRDYVLCVGTLSVHKNQSFLVQVWQLLVQEGCEPPLLVLAGARNHGADEILNRLQWSKYVGGRVRVVDMPSDEELAVLYRHCLFTIFPSLVEGWGLPIGESLAHGKLCIASRLAGMPEAGGEHALYIDPYNQRACAELLRELFADRARVASCETRIRAGFKPRGWHDHARDFIAAVKEGAAAKPPPPRQPPPGALSLPRKAPPGWRFGRTLPGHAAFADALNGRMVLTRGWRPAETWGAWMAGRYARLAFATDLAPGSAVTVLLQFKAAPWARGNLLQVSSACGARTSAPVPDAEITQAGWRGQRDRELLVGIDCAVLADGSVNLLLEIAGPLARGWSETDRALCLGLVRLACLPAEAAAAAHPLNQRLRPAALVGPSGEPAYPVGLQSMLAAFRGARMLAAGWQAPDASAAWMSGGAARLRLAAEAASDETVRVALQLRSASVPAGIEIVLAAACGASKVWRLPGDAAAEWVWLDCRVGADRGLLIDITDPGLRPGAPGRIGLVNIVYGRRETPEHRLALTEAMLSPAPDDAGSSQAALVADLRFTVAGHLKGSYSLAAINRSLALALEHASRGTVRVEQIETDPVRDLGGVPAAERDLLAVLAERDRDPTGAEVAIVQHWPVLPPPVPCDLPLALFVWEESLVPGAIVEQLNRDYRGVLAQTDAVAKALLDSGVAVPVHVVGCAIDLSRFSAIAEQRASAGPRAAIDLSNPFAFLHVSSGLARKGVDLLLAAYAEAFRRNDPVRLVIKTFPNPDNDVAQQVDRLRAGDPDAPDIELVDRELDEDALARLYADADAMVLSSRGEGFNMPAAEAMAAGLPLIVTGHGGHMDFAGPDVARTLDYRFAASQSHVRAPGSLWVEPDRADLIAALRETVAKARDRAGAEPPFARQIEQARRAVAPLGDRAAWARRVVDSARRLITADPPRRVTVGWISTWKVRCGIAEYSHHLLSHFDGAARDVTVFCDRRTDAGQLAPCDGPAARIAWRTHDEPSMDELAAAIDGAGVDAVVVQQHVGYLRWPALARLLRDRRVESRPVLVFIHNVRYLFREAPGDLADIVDALGRAARVLVHSESDVNLLKSLGLVDNVTLFPHGAERAHLGSPPVRSFGAGGAPLLGAYGFFLPPKGFDRLVRALPALRARWAGLRLRFVAAEYPAPESAEALAQCRELAQSLGVADSIEWITDYLPNRRSLELLNECDLIVLPYRETTESASGAVRVALASRAPVAVTPIRLFDDLGGAALRLPGCEVEDVVSGIMSVLEDDARRHEAIAASGRWLEDHDWKLMAARLQGMLTGLVATERTLM